MRDALAAFERSVESDLWELRTPRIELWRTRNFKPAPSDPCQLCGRTSDAPLVLAHLLSVELGGPHSEENLLTACKQCSTRAQVSDWITWKGKPKSLTPTLATRRLEVLALSENHLLRTRDDARTKPYLLKKLQQRWQHPRFVVRACLTEQGGLLAFPQHSPMPDDIAVQVRLNGGQPVPGAPRVFQIEAARFLDLMWLLIDQNAWVRRMEPEGFPDPMPADDGASRWHETYKSVGDLHRRRERLPWVHPRDRPAWHEKPMDPRTRKHLAALLALKTDQPLDKEWLDRHREADDAHVEGERKRRDREWLLRRQN